MELELQRTCLNGFQMVLNRTVIQEETLEGIVPDFCPDIMRIVDASGQIYVTGRELSKGSLKVSGVVRVAILYIPDDENGPHHMDIQIPFNCTADDPALHGGCKIYAAPRICSVDTHAINPRKVLTRVELAIDLQVYAPGENDTCMGVSCRENESGIQQRTKERETYLISALQEKSFTFSDVLNFPVAHAHARELLRSRLEARNLEAKIIGGKLIIKGEVELNALCRAEEGLVFAEHFHLPYSQVMELNGVGEECDVQVECFIAALECSMQPGDPASLAVTLELLAQAVVHEKRMVTMLDDLYCTHCPLELEHGDLMIEHLRGRETRRESVRQFCECGIPAKNVVDTSVAIGRVTHTREGDAFLLRAETNITILFFSEDDALCSVTYPVPVISTLSTAEECELLYRCAVMGMPTAVPVTGGLEVRFELEFPIVMHQTERCMFVSGIRELPQEENTGRHPSVILRMVGERDELWDIAKAYHSTVSDIMAANGLENESAPAGKMLLIPWCR